jgi:hypothetical protein
MRRNAVAAPAIPRAIARPRRPTASELLEAEQEKLKEDSRGWRLINGIGGALATGAAGLLLEHQTTLPITWMTVGLTGLGAALALGAPNKTVRSIGVGAAAAGTTLLGTLADKEWFPRESRRDDHPQVAASPTTAKPPTPGKKQSNATDIPADALARAYERARLRMALASEPPN